MDNAIFLMTVETLYSRHHCIDMPDKYYNTAAIAHTHNRPHTILIDRATVANIVLHIVVEVITLKSGAK